MNDRINSNYKTYLAAFKWVFLLLITQLIIESYESAIIRFTSNNSFLDQNLNFGVIKGHDYIFFSFLFLLIPIFCIYSVRYFITTPWAIYYDIEDIEGDNIGRVEKSKNSGAYSISVSGIFLIIEFTILFLAAKSIGNLGFLFLFVLILPLADIALFLLIILPKIAFYSLSILVLWLVKLLVLFVISIILFVLAILSLLVCLPVEIALFIVEVFKESEDAKSRFVNTFNKIKSFFLMPREKVSVFFKIRIKKFKKKWPQSSPLIKRVLYFIKGARFIFWDALDLFLPILMFIILNFIFFSFNLSAIFNFSNFNFWNAIENISKPPVAILTCFSLVSGILLSNIFNIWGNWKKYKKYIEYLVIDKRRD